MSKSGDQKPNNIPLALSHVCARWRQISLSIPILWTDIDSRRHPLHNQLYIQRSGSHPLTIWAELECPAGFGDFLNEFMSRVFVFRTINARAFPPDEITPMRSFIDLVYSASNLHVLDCRCQFMRTDATVHLVHLDRYPQLQFLRLEHYKWISPQSPLNHLTHLSLRFDYDNHAAFSRFWFHLFDLLEHTRILENLDIRCYNGAKSSETRHWTSTIHLPRLKYLSMTSSHFISFHHLLELVVFPPDCIVAFYHHGQESAIATPYGLFSFVPPEEHSGLSPGFLQNTTVLHIERFRETDTFRRQDFPFHSRPSLDLTGGNGNGTSTFRFRLEHSGLTESAVSDTLRDIPRFLSHQCAHLRELWLGPNWDGCGIFDKDRDGVPAETRQSWLTALPSLELLALPFKFRDPDIIYAPPGSFEDNGVVCPRLHTIHAFLSWTAGTLKNINKWPTLQDLLKRRHEMGRSIKHLHFHLRRIESEELSSFGNPKLSVWGSTREGPSANFKTFASRSLHGESIVSLHSFLSNPLRLPIS